jgi:putative DNA primase/helicase
MLAGGFFNMAKKNNHQDKRAPGSFNAVGRSFLEGQIHKNLSMNPIEETQKWQTNNGRLDSFAQLQCAGDVQPQPINWLWPNRIALGKLTMIAGDPGLGKSLLSIELAKHVTNGIRWPVDDTPCPTGDVILLSAEDDLADTIRPRLDAAGADPHKVYLLERIIDINKKGQHIKRSFSLKRDVAAIEQELEQRPQTRLIVVDPISAYLGGADSHNNSDIRSLLSPLSELANKKKVAVVLITHLNKSSSQGSAMYRATGSLAFVAAARAVFIVTRDQDDPDRRLFLPIKNNLGTDREGFAYRVIQADNGAPIVDWEDEAVTISADDALAVLSNEDKTKRQDAISFLERKLKDRHVDSEELFKSAESCGISRSTLNRAKSELGVDSFKTGFEGGWAWRLKQEDLSEG